MKDKDLLKLLLKNGWQDVRQRGSHHRLVKGDKFEVICPRQRYADRTAERHTKENGTEISPAWVTKEVIKMLFIYPAVIHEDADGMWAEFPDLEGCTTYGDTMEEILSGAAEAMELYVLGMMEDGVQPPMPTDIKEIKRLDKNAFATLIQSDVDLAKNTKSVKKTLTIPAWLNQRALDKGINFSKVLQEALVAKTV